MQIQSVQSTHSAVALPASNKPDFACVTSSESD